MNLAVKGVPYTTGRGGRLGGRRTWDGRAKDMSFVHLPIPHILDLVSFQCEK